MKKTITIGIIAYKVEQYIRLCLESAIRQKGDDIEIIVVDDGSPDGSGKICDEFAALDSRVKVIHKENGGASTARNAIIEEATGDWICFVDGDDRLDDKATETIRKKLSDEYQIIFFDAVPFRNDDAVPAYKVDLPDMELTGDVINKLSSRTMYYDDTSNEFVNITLVCPWGKVYNRKFLLENGLKFEPAAIRGQDMVFSFYCTTYLKKALMVRESIYNYRLNMVSISNRFNPKMPGYNKIAIELLHEHMIKYGRNDPELMNSYYARCINCIKTACELYFCNKSNDKPYKEREKEFLEYIAQPVYVEAIENCDIADLKKQAAMVFKSLKKNDFRGICRFFKIKDQYNKFKLVLSKFGIEKM